MRVVNASIVFGTRSIIEGSKQANVLCLEEQSWTSKIQMCI